MDIVDGYYGTKSVLCLKEKAAYENIEVLMSKLSIIDTDGLTYLKSTLEEQLNRVREDTWLYKFKIKKASFLNAITKHKSGNVDRLDLVYRTMRELQMFIVNNTRAYSDHIKQVDALFKMAIDEQYEEFNKLYMNIELGTNPCWSIKSNVKQSLEDRIDRYALFGRHIKLISISDARARVSVLPQLTTAEIITAQQIVNQIQDFYCDTNTAWANRYISEYFPNSENIKRQDMLERVLTLKHEYRITTWKCFENLFCFNVYGSMVNLKEVLVGISREIESWIANSRQP